MIPRLKPYLGMTELVAALQPGNGAVERFEGEFARAFNARYALSFAYGRSALWAFFKALGIENAEVIMPAYTCVVVAHATVLSGNVPRFVDVCLSDYNMCLDQVEAAVNERTRVIVATHLFGYPLDVDRLASIVKAAESRWGHKIWVIQDCAHSFGASWQGKLVCNQGDAALYGLNISKMITSVFGGMLTTDDEKLYRRLSAFREEYFKRPGVSKRLRRLLYLLALYPAFYERVYNLVNWLEEDTSFLNHLTKAYHLDEQIHFPPDHLDRMIELEAGVGLVQLAKYPQIVERRRETAAYYDQHLRDVPQLTLPPLITGATYSHYVVRVADRQAMLEGLRRRGIQLGELIQCSVPHMAAYRPYAGDEEYPNSRLCSQSTINLPVQASLSEEKRFQIADSVRNVAATIVAGPLDL